MVATSRSSEGRAALANELRIGDDAVDVLLSDGRTMTVRYEDYEFLRNAPLGHRKDVVIEDGGTVLWWEPLLEGISVAGLLAVTEDALYDLAESKGRIRFTYSHGRWRDPT